MKAKVNYKQLGLDILEFIKEFGELLPVPLEGKYQYARRLRRIQKYPSWKVNQKVKSLKDKGLISGRGKYKVTKNGEVELLIEAIRHQDDPVEFGKNILVVFDIPERKTRSRNLLRTMLRNIGFESVQRSVMLGKKYLPKEFNKLIELLNISGDVKVYKAEEISV